MVSTSTEPTGVQPKHISTTSPSDSSSSKGRVFEARAEAVCTKPAALNGPMAAVDHLKQAAAAVQVSRDLASLGGHSDHTDAERWTTSEFNKRIWCPEKVWFYHL
uniref:Uncharacterized protein n=1 Tax=Knipowitschia caucasica TaxID=637954 RepID=A0AAV2JKW8_KNICA